MAKVSKHGRKRTKERLGLSKKDADKNAQKALDNGLLHSECKGDLKRYIAKLYFKNGSGMYRIYQHHIYCFKNDILVTVMNLPPNLHKLADTLYKKKLEHKEK